MKEMYHNLINSLIINQRKIVVKQLYCKSEWSYTIIQSMHIIDANDNFFYVKKERRWL